MSRLYFTLSLLVLIGACSGLWKGADPLAPFDPPPIATPIVTLQERPAPHRIELRNFSSASSPAVAVFDSSYRQVGSAAGNGDSLSLSVPGKLSGRHMIVVRSLSSESASSADLWVDGKLAVPGLRFSAGRKVDVPRTRNAVAVLGVPPPRGAASHVALALSADGSSIRQISRGLSTRLDLPPGGDHRIVFGASAVGPIRTFVNEYPVDSDGDGLSNWLEAQLDTCPSRSGSAPGVDCARIADARDTDGDALWDSWEVLGFDGRLYGLEGGQPLPLPTWGANPRHKDVFVEVDFRRLDKAENDSNLASKMNAANARAMAAIYADDATTDSGVRLRHARSVKNPDGRPGISLHLDTGVPPETPADATIYGDWGGYTAVNAVPDPGQPGSFIPQTPTAIWREQMAKARHGIFHYVLGYTTGGGACYLSSIACGFNFDSTYNSVHEFGHTFNLDHAGRPGSAEPNCKPNYPSGMNYAGTSQFSDGRALSTLNNHALIETGALSPNHQLLPRLRDAFRYTVDPSTGSVDWNRDGRFSPPGSPVRAYANYQPGGNCEFTRAGSTPIGMTSNRSPAIVRFDNHLWVFAVTPEKKLIYTYTPQPFVCPNIDRCPAPAFHPFSERGAGQIEGVDAVTMTVAGRRFLLIVGLRTDGSLFETFMETRAGLFVWSGTNAIPASPAGGEPSLAVSHNGSSVALAYRGRDGAVRYRFRTPSGFGNERTVMTGGQPLAMPPHASPSLAFARLRLPTDIALDTEHLIGAFIARGVELYAFDGRSQDWSKLAIPYSPMPAPGSPVQRFATGRPALAWVGPASGAATNGSWAPANPTTYPRLYVIYIERGQPNPSHPMPNPVRMALSYVDAAGTLRIGLDSYFDNMWSYAHGLDLLHPGEVGLRAAETYVIKGAPWNQVYLRPHADGMADQTYRNHDDWRMLGWGACNTLSSVQPDAVRTGCLPAYW